MVVSVLASAGDREAHASRVPGADTSHLAETAVSLARQAGHTPTGDDAFCAVSLRGAQHVDALVLLANKTKESGGAGKI